MAGRGELICLAPGLLGPVPATLADALPSVGPFPVLEALLGRSGRHAASRSDGEGLLRSLAEPAPSVGDLLAAEFDIQGDRVCYRAAPTHLRPDRDRLLLFAGDTLNPPADEAETICRDFNHLFSEDGLSLQVRGGEWLLIADSAPGPDLPPLSTVAGRYLDTVIPNDAAARPWRKLLNEVQMFLHDHPANTARQSRGELPINGLWFWGGGSRSDGRLTLPVRNIHGDDPIARGLARSGSDVQYERDVPPAMSLAEGGPRAFVWTAAERALLGGDAEAWLGALQRFESGYAGILRDLVFEHGGRVELRCANGWTHRITPVDRWRLWRRPKPLREWLVVE